MTWRGVAEEGAGQRTVAQHQAILDAMIARDPGRASSAALVHVATTEAWFRRAVADRLALQADPVDVPPAQAAGRARARR